MAGKLENGNLRMAIMVGGFVLTICTIVFAAGGIQPAIDENSKAITEHHENGCKPSIGARQDIARLQAEVEALKQMRDDIKEIKSILMNPIR